MNTIAVKVIVCLMVFLVIMASSFILSVFAAIVTGLAIFAVWPVTAIVVLVLWWMMPHATEEEDRFGHRD